MDYMAEFAQRLKAQRDKVGFTQAQLAEKIGVSSQTISAYEKNSAGEKGKTPTLDKAVALAQTLGVSLDYLCGVLLDIEEENEPFENLADVVSHLKILTRYFRCDVSSKKIDLDEDECYTTFDEQGDGAEVTTSDAAVLTIRSEMLAHFFVKRNKMYRLYLEGTIEQDMFNSWVQGEAEKLKKIPVIERMFGADDFELEL